MHSHTPQRPLGFDLRAHWPFVLSLLIAALIVAVRIRFLEIPLGRNEGSYGYLASQLLRGAVPFVDFYEMKPVGLYYTYAFFVGVFGGTSGGLHVGLLILNLATVLLVYGIARRLFGAVAAAVAAVTFGFLTLHPPMMGLALDVEHLINFFVCLAILLVLIGNERDRHVFFVLAGVSGVWAMSIKHTAALALLPIALFCLVDWETKDRRSRLPRRLIALSAGAAVSIACVFFDHLVRGNLADAIYWMVEYPSTQYVVSVSASEAWSFLVQKLGTVIVSQAWVYGIAVCGLGVACLRRGHFVVEARVLLGMWFVAALMIAPGLRFYGHYWLYLAPVVSLAAGLALARVRGVAKQRPAWEIGVTIATVVYLLAMPASLMRSSWNFFSATPDAMNHKIYDYNPFPEIRTISETIRERMRPEDRVVVFGSEPQAYLELGVQAPTRHVFLAFLTRPHPRQAAAIAEFEADIERAMPRFAIFVRDGRSWMFRREDGQALFDWSTRFVSRHYRPILLADLVRFDETHWIRGPEILTYSPRTPRAVVLYERIAAAARGQNLGDEPD